MKRKIFILLITLLSIIISIVATIGCNNKNNIKLNDNKGSINKEETNTPQPNQNQYPISKESLGHFETKILDSDQDRIENIKIASRAINGTVVLPGNQFSFNGVVGKRSPEKGYQKAKIIINGESEEGFGGGICQLSSTIYNAALLANLEVLERHSHSKPVKYIAENKDAAITYGSMDLVFRNNKEFPISIETYIKNGKVAVDLWKTIS